MRFNSTRTVTAFCVASLFPLALQVVGLFGFSGSVRDANGNFSPGRISKYIDIMLYAQGPFSIIVTIIGLAVLLSLAEHVGATHSRGIITLAIALGMGAGAVLAVLLSLATLKASVLLAACALLSAATAAIFCVVAGIPWRKT